MRNVCSVSSLTIPRPNTSRWRNGPVNRLAILDRVKPSAGNSKLSPRAVPSKQPTNRSISSMRSPLRKVARWHGLDQPDPIVRTVKNMAIIMHAVGIDFQHQRISMS